VFRIIIHRDKDGFRMTSGYDKSKESRTVEYDYSLIPPKCPNCRAMPVNDETPKDMYREHGECHCEETQEETSCQDS